MVHRAGHHEQRALVKAVHQRQEHRRLEGKRIPETQQHHQRAQDTHGGIGEQALEVGLIDGNRCAGEHGQRAHRCHDPAPQWSAGHRRIKFRQQDHAGLHHGGGVQVGAHRRGCGHRPGQPEMEWDLRGFRENTRQDQQQRWHEQRARGNLVRMLRQRGNARFAGDLRQQDQASQ